MKSVFVAPILCASALLSFAGDAAATSFIATDNHAVVAIDARTGERRWSHYPDKLSQADCELYPGYLHVEGNIETVNPSQDFTLALDPATGKQIPEVMQTGTPLARSAFPSAPRTLANGWTLDWDPGNDKQLVFVDDKGVAAWTIETNDYPENVVVWQNTVFWELGYDSTTVYAQEAGTSAPSFTFDPKTLVTVPNTLPNSRLHMAVFDDELYIGLHQHLFRLDPKTGAIQKQWDLSALTGVPFTGENWGDPEFFYGGIEMADYAADAATLVLAYEARVVGLDRASGDVLWHFNPGAGPNKPNPLLHDGLLVVTAAGEIAGPRPEPPPAPQLEATGCTFAASPQSSSAALLATLLGGLVAFARRKRASQ